jgi:hypothetical protein
MTHAQCGTQFGNVAYVNGGTVGSPYTHYYPNQQPNSEWRNVICIRNSFHYSCTTHLAAGASWYTYDQLYRYRDIVNVIAVSSGLGVYASGDFNAPLQTSWYSTWTGWLEADSSLNRVTYPPNSAKFDYVFRRTPASWSHGAYVAMFPGLSDHLWVQGYL